MNVRASRALPALAAALLLLAGACRDLPTAPLAPLTPQNAQRQAMRCGVDVKARRFTCAAPNLLRGPRPNVELGGQGLHVRLVSGPVAYDSSTQELSATVVIQNLLDQPMGTNGTDTTGTRVFFSSGPVVTSGTGSVGVITDSVGTFTASNQPYYLYPGAIAPRNYSPGVLWRFSMSPTVVNFEFLVLVDTQLPAETSILHWRPERGTQVYPGTYYGVWAASAHDVFAVSDGSVVHYDGNYWRAMDAGPCGCPVYAVSGRNARDVWTTGANGLVMHWTGAAWDSVDTQGVPLSDGFGVWASPSSSDVWVVGDFGRIIHYDGSTWTDTDSGLESPIFSVWGSGPNDVWAVGESGIVAHWDGTSLTSSVPAAVSGTASLYAVWGTGPNDVWAAGAEDGITPVLYHYDGTDWSAVSDPALVEPIYAGWSGGANDVWLAAGGSVLHWDGATWSSQPIGSGAPLYGITGTGTTRFVVGDFGTLARQSGAGGWQTMGLDEQDIYALWGSGPHDVWGVGGNVLVHGDGTGSWTLDFTPGGEGMFGVWGTAQSDVYAVGELGTVLHYDGGSWSVAHVDSALTLNAVWGSSSTDVWAVGDAGAVLHWDGAAWSTSTVGTASLNAVWGSSSTNVFAVAAGGSIQHWDGAAWSPMNSGTASALHGVWGSGAGDVYAVGDAGTLLHYDGNPSGDWTAVSTPADPAKPIYAIWGSGAGDVFASANAGTTLLHWDGSSWRTMVPFSSNADVELYTIWGSGPRDVYAAGDLGTIVHGTR